MKLVAALDLNHEGNFDLVYHMIGRASRAGADAVKFQFGYFGDPGQINYIDTDRAYRLKEWCQWWEVGFEAAVMSEEALEMAILVDPDHYHVASRTVVDKPQLAEWVLAEADEPYVALGRWKDREFPFGSPSNELRYIYSAADSPCYPDQLREMPRRFEPDGIYGYRDQLHGVEGCLLAASRGARYLETRLTFNQATQSIHDDHVVSTTPEQFEQLRQLARPLCRLADVVDGRREAPAPTP